MNDFNSNATRLDANQYGYFETNQLEYVMAKAYNVMYPEFKGLQILPISTETPAWAQTITYYTFDRVGMAKIIADYADDLPRADILGRKTSADVRAIGTSFGYNIQEIITAQVLKQPLADMRALNARKANDQKVNQLIFFGDETHGLVGFANNPNVTRYDVAATGTGSSTLWINKTPQQIYYDMTSLITGINTLTLGIETPDTLLLPLSQYNYIKATPFSPTFMADSILQYFTKNNPEITVIAVNELKGAASDGSDIMIAYTNSEDKLRVEIPQPYTQLPPQQRNLEYVIPCHSRFGGVSIFYPLSVAIGEGI